MIKKRIFPIFLSISVLSCVFIGPQVTITGEKRPALPEDAEVIIYNQYPDNYIEVGYTVLRGNSFERRLEEAQRIARKNGCNGIVPRKEEVKERTWQEPIYRTETTTDPFTGMTKTRRVFARYETRYEKWIEQLFFIIYVE